MLQLVSSSKPAGVKALGFGLWFKMAGEGGMQQQRIETVEMHTGGEPLRIIVKGYPNTEGSTILDKRRYLRENVDHYRKMLMHEPRGHREMYGALLVPPDHPEAHIGVIFMHNEGYSTMCGHAVIALGRFAVDHGYVEPVSPETVVNIQCPCGVVVAHVEYDSGVTGKVRFESVPSFAFSVDQKVHLEPYGDIVYDISFGGTFYAVVDSKYFGLDLCTASESEIQTAGKALTNHLRSVVKLEHPDNSDLAFLYGTIITDGKDGYSTSSSSSNVCIFAEGQVDRSPTGSGVQARLALQYHKGLIKVGQVKSFVQSLVGSEFAGRVLREEACGHHKGVVVEVSGKGHYTGTASFWQEMDDSLKNGFWLH